MEAAEKMTQTCGGTTLNCFAEVPLDTRTIPQTRLDLANRARTNPFPWRGQFSPELIELLLETFATSGTLVFDPFVGIGTTLIEAARAGFSSCGTEINPAAVTMAETVMFVGMPIARRRALLSSVDQILRESFSHPPSQTNGREASIADTLLRLIALHKRKSYVRSVLANVLLRVLESKSPNCIKSVHRSFAIHRDIVLELPLSNKQCEVLNADARETPLGLGSVQLVVSSPPYINVFNYHQNCRPAMELLGWNLLQVAKSEFGSNRKNRGNRFLTVVQYCIDMFDALSEVRRLLDSSGRVILIVGRESNVRGTRFYNGEIVSSVANLAGLNLTMRQERKFKNKFGTIIFEDILHFTSSHKDSGNPRKLAADILAESLETAPSESVRQDILSAIDRADSVAPSPLFNPKEAVAI